MLKKIKSLKVKFSILTFLTYLFLIWTVITACYVWFFYNTMNTYVELGDELLNLAAKDIEVDNIPHYMKGTYSIKEYQSIRTKLDNIVEEFNMIYYMYVLRIDDTEDSAKYVFDAQTDHDKAYYLNDDYELEEDLLENIDSMRAGKSIKPLVDNTKWGFLLTCSKPLYDSHGDCQAYVFIDFNLTAIREKSIRFIIILFVVVFSIMVAVFLWGMKKVIKRITGPIESMYKCISTFKYDTEEDMRNNIRAFDELNIKTNPEIQSLYEIFADTLKRRVEYQHDLKVTTDKLDDMEEIAYVDIMTGLGNKYAYEERIRTLQQRIDSGVVQDFAIVMADINNLKYVNDTFGHDKGDTYIKGCVDILKESFSGNNIFRVGGDEFVIFLDDDTYESRLQALEAANMAYKKLQTREDIEPYERFSVSLGLAENTGQSSRVADVIKDADARMYEEKQVYRTLYGRYR